MAEAAATKNAGAILWKIEKDGRPTSYLFGTVHLTDERVTKLSPAVRAGPQRGEGQSRSRFPTSPRTPPPSVIAQSAPLVMFTDGRRLDSAAVEHRVRHGQAIIARSGMPVDLAALFKPWIVTMILSVSDCERTKVQQGARVLDMKIAEIGKARGLQVVGPRDHPGAAAGACRGSRAAAARHAARAA